MTRIMTIFIFFLLTYPSWASESSQVKEGNQFYKERKWDEAIDRYYNALEKGKHEDILHYDLGSAFYKKSDYDQSIEHLKKSLVSKDQKLQSNAYYNLGNVFFQKGRSLENQDINKAIDSLRQSLANYDQTLKISPKDEDAIYNRKVAEEEIKRLEQKKKEQQSSNSQKQDNKEDRKDKKDQQNQSSSNNQNQDNQSSSENKEQDKGQENKKSESNGQENKDKQSKESKGQQPQGSSQKGAQEDSIKKQAQQILDDYQRDEAPKGLMNFIKRSKGEEHVDKDW